jgi:hypothetical protein
MLLKLRYKRDIHMSIVRISTAMKMKSDKESKIGEVIERKSGLRVKYIELKTEELTF